LYPWFIQTESGKLEVAKHPDFQEPSRINTHKNARLTFARRLEMVQYITEHGPSVPEATLKEVASRIEAVLQAR